MKKASGENTEKGAKIGIIILIVLLVLIAVPLALIFIFGRTGAIDEGIPDVGVDVVNVPFSGEGAMEIPIQWLVHGVSEGEPVISGVYFSTLPSQVEFTTATTPDITGYMGFVPGQETELPNGVKVLQAGVPNAYEVVYVRIHALIGDKNYWSDEFIIEAS